MNRRVVFFLAFLSAFSVGVYLLASALTYQLGFPLDDAWIHQTYARNLGIRGEWAYLPSHPSAGSTAPLWSAILAIGYALHLGPYPWTYLLGWALLLGLSLIATSLWKYVCAEKVNWAIAAGILMALEWHLVWAAVSGMETLLLAFLAVLVLGWLLAGWEHWVGLGLLIGMSIWVRPDGLTFLGPAAFVILLSARGWKYRLRAGGGLILGVLAPLGSYLLFNYLLAGTFWPNTFYAKQAEYAILRQEPLWQRFWAEASLPLVGVGILLAAGFIFWIIKAIQQRAWSKLAAPLWAVGYLALYAWRLPVVYQHGRYVIPAMPVIFLWGLAGLAAWTQPGASQLWRRVLSKAFLAAAAGILLVFWILGARAYAQDVAFIESEMVVTARWIAENTPANAIIAAHDIGALGYYLGDQRRLVDLAGLISPEVIPFIQDEDRLAEYLDGVGAEYLVTFPGWYPQFMQRAQLLYQTKGGFAPVIGGENMAVYLWKTR